MAAPSTPAAAVTSPSGRPRRSARRVAAVLVAVVAMVAVGAVGGYLVGHHDHRSEPGAVDIGFLQDMSLHHDQGVQIALLALNRHPGAEVEGFAIDVVRIQQRERGVMDALLAGWGRDEGDPSRPTAMAWMGMAMPMAQMPGLQPQEAMDRLATSEGAELDRLFLTMMRQHHQGGLHMAQYAMGRATSPEVRDLASTMARVQVAEIQDYTRAMQLMGFES